MIQNDMTITVDGIESTSLAPGDSLARAVIISLFTWRRANADDIAEGQKMGWFGDVAEPLVVNDKIGSRLWLLSRAKLVNDTFNRAREYAKEALQWLIDDQIAVRVEVTAERYGVDGLALVCTIYRDDGSNVSLRFNDVWEKIRVI
jgi:phage gp46-like protein